MTNRYLAFDEVDDVAETVVDALKEVACPLDLAISGLFRAALELAHEHDEPLVVLEEMLHELRRRL